MENLPLSIKEKCRELLGTPLLSVQYIGSGDINQARLLETAEGKFFLKFNTKSEAFDMFQKEAHGLEVLRKPNVISIPEVLGIGESKDAAFLILEYIQSGHRIGNFWLDFGRKLADLHRITQPKFGLNYSNYIGSLVQQNNPHSNWTEFYISERLMPQMKLARDMNRLKITDNQSFELLFKKLPDLLPEEKPSLIHGDLWSGNFMANTNQQPVLIDPAVYFGNREMDIAMTKLFGGFDSDFYASYMESFPLKPGYSRRIKLYQLYYLMVHVNLFAGGYINSVRRILKDYI